MTPEVAEGISCPIPKTPKAYGRPSRIQRLCPAPQAGTPRPTAASALVSGSTLIRSTITPPPHGIESLWT